MTKILRDNVEYCNLPKGRAALDRGMRLPSKSGALSIGASHSIIPFAHSLRVAPLTAQKVATENHTTSPLVRLRGQWVRKQRPYSHQRCWAHQPTWRPFELPFVPPHKLAYSGLRKRPESRQSPSRREQQFPSSVDERQPTRKA